MLHYLGGLRGAGELTWGYAVARVEYDLEIYQMGAGQVTGCGEIGLPHEAQARASDFANACLVTDDGWRLHLSFSDKSAPPQEKVAHVDVVGGLPPAQHWSLMLTAPPSRSPASKAAPKWRRAATNS